MTSISRILMSTAIPLVMVLTAVGCADNVASTSNEGTLSVEASMVQSSVPFGKLVRSDADANLLGGGLSVDSLRITSVKLLISEIKLVSKDGSGTEVKVKSGPAILSVDQTGSRLSTSGVIPIGTYNKVMLKFHRFKDDDIQPFLTNPDFIEFVNNERYSIVITGIGYKAGQSFNFTFGGKVEEVIKFDMAEVVVVPSGSTGIIVGVDLVAGFKDSADRLVLDPRDPDNQSKIEKALKAAIKVWRK